MKRAVLILLAACGTPDPDIPLPEGPFEPGPVFIKVTSHGKPAVNVPVIFQNAGSEVVSSTLTDFDGAAEATLEGSGFVTVIEPREPSAPREILSTFAGVQGNDELHLDLAPLGPTQVTEFLLEIEPDTAAPGGHRVLSSCGPIDSFTLVGNTPPDPPKAQLLGCGTVADILVVSLDDFGEPLRSRFHEAVPLTDQTLMGPYVDVGAAMIEYRNIPDVVGFVGVYRALARNTRVVFDVSTGVTSDAGSGMAPIKVPVTSSLIRMTASSTFPIDDELGTQLVIDWDDGNSDYVLDLGSAMLPRYTAPPVFDAERRTATWEEEPGDTEPDAVRMHLQIHRPGIPTGAAWEWRMLGVRTGTSFTFPKLPVDDGSGFDFNPVSDDTVNVQALTTAKLPAGFDNTLRSRGFLPFEALRSGTSGRIVTQDLFVTGPIPEPEL